MSEFSQQMASWLHAQQQFWQQILAEHQPHATADATTPHAMAALLNQLNHQAEAFQRFGETLLQQAATGNDPDQQLDAFVSYIQQQQTILELRRWQLPEYLITLFAQPDVRDACLNSTAFSDHLRSLLDHPFPGLTTAQHTRMLEAHQHMADYQHRLRDYLQQQDQITLQARDLLKADLTNAQPPVQTLAELHERWASHYENAYRDAVFSPAYQQAYGALSNALMRLQHCAQQWRDEHYENAGLVSLTLFDQLLQQHAQLRKTLRQQEKTNRQLQQQLAALQQAPWQQTLARMQQQIDTLQQQLDTLTGTHGEQR